jgi:hypothetical protein
MLRILANTCVGTSPTVLSSRTDSQSPGILIFRFTISYAQSFSQLCPSSQPLSRSYSRHTSPCPSPSLSTNLHLPCRPFHRRLIHRAALVFMQVQDIRAQSEGHQHTETFLRHFSRCRLNLKGGYTHVSIHNLQLGCHHSSVYTFTSISTPRIDSFA